MTRTRSSPFLRLWRCSSTANFRARDPGLVWLEVAVTATTGNFGQVSVIKKPLELKFGLAQGASYDSDIIIAVFGIVGMFFVWVLNIAVFPIKRSVILWGRRRGGRGRGGRHTCLGAFLSLRLESHQLCLSTHVNSLNDLTNKSFLKNMTSSDIFDACERFCGDTG
jgi:hypothetical protein